MVPCAFLYMRSVRLIISLLCCRLNLRCTSWHPVQLPSVRQKTTQTQAPKGMHVVVSGAGPCGLLVALQLQLAAPQTERGWGASVWIGAASIVAA